MGGAVSLAFSQWPWVLAALPLAVWIFWLARTSHAALAPWRWWSSTLLRLTMVLSLLGALAGLTLVRRTDELGVYFVVDLSRSVSADEQKGAMDWVGGALRGMDPRRDRAGLIVFGADAAVEHPLDRALPLGRISVPFNPDFTDVSQAIRLAVASFPAGVQKRIVLLTDGEENLGDGLEAAREARAAGVDVWVRPLAARRGRDAAVEKITIPPDAKVGEAFDVTVHTRLAGVPRGETRKGILRLFRNRQLVGSFEVELAGGEDVFRIPQKILAEEGAGGYEYEAVLQVADDSQHENNRAFGFTRVEGESRVLLIEGAPGLSRELAAVMRDAGIRNLDVAGPGAFPQTMPELQTYDAVILQDVPAFAFTAGATGQMQLMKDFVENHGGGLLVVGGPHSYGLGGYFRTPIEDALPVTMDIKKRKMRASMALVIAIDQSGSMSATVPGGQTKIQLANEAAVKVVEMLDERDQLGVVYVDTAPKWAVRVVRLTAGAKSGVIRDIRSNHGGGGGIYVYSALEAAYAALDKVEALIKHVILFSDASDSEQQENCVQRAIKERGKGRTLTVIGMGRETDCHGDFLKDLAKAGDGRIVFVEDVRKLPEIFTSETVTASKSAIVETTFQPKLTGPFTGVQGIDWATCPPLHGYVTTTLKPRGEKILEGTEEDPVLSKWQFGLGRSAAWTSDAVPQWSKDWIGWEGYRKLWPQLVRWSARRRAAGDHRMAMTLENGRGRVSIDAFDAKGDPVNFLDLTARVSGPDGRSSAVRLAQRGSGRYEAEFPADSSGAWFVTVGDREQNVVARAGGAVSYPPEFRAPEGRIELPSTIARATGGKVLDLPQGIFEHSGTPAESPREIWPWLLAAALAALMLDVACRRLPLPELAAAGWDRLRFRRAKAEPKGPANELLERLKAAKESAAAAVEPPPAKPSASVERILRSAPPPPDAPAPAPVPETAPPPPTAPEAGPAYLQRLLDAKKKAKE